MSTLSLPLTIYEQIRAHGERTYPDECCGALLGRSTPAGWQVEAVVETGNSRTDSPHNRFRIPPLDLVKSWRLPVFTTPTLTTRQIGRGLTWPRPTGSAAPLSSPASSRARPPKPAPFC
jgi:hypothetical protein